MFGLRFRDSIILVACCLGPAKAEGLGTFGSMGYSIEWMAQHSDAIGIYQAEDPTSKGTIRLFLDSAVKSSPPPSLDIDWGELPTMEGPYLVFLIAFGEASHRVTDEKVIDLSSLSAPGHWAASMTFDIYSSVDSVLRAVQMWADSIQDGDCPGRGFNLEIPDSSVLGKALLKPIYRHTLAVPESPLVRLQLLESARKATGRKRVHAILQLQRAYPCENFMGLLRDMLSDPETRNWFGCKCYPARQYAFKELRKTSERPPRPHGYDDRCSTSYYSLTDGFWP